MLWTDKGVRFLPLMIQVAVLLINVLSKTVRLRIIHAEGQPRRFVVPHHACRRDSVPYHEPSPPPNACHLRCERLQGA